MGKPSAIVYVDGFNLYKGQLESRPSHKWLNLVSLFDDVLDDFQVVHVHYFTARIKGRMNPEDPQAPDRQAAYIRALRTLDRLTVHDDSLFTVHHGFAREWIDGKEQPPLTRHHVYKVQEKGSDVKLATQLLMDALDGAADTYVVVSSDSDLARPIEVARTRFDARVGVLYPETNGRNCSRQPGSTSASTSVRATPHATNSRMSCTQQNDRFTGHPPGNSKASHECEALSLIQKNRGCASTVAGSSTLWRECATPALPVPPLRSPAIGYRVSAPREEARRVCGPGPSDPA